MHETVCVCVQKQKQKQNPDTRLPPADQSADTAPLNTMKGTEYHEVSTRINSSLMSATSCIGQ